MNISLVGEKFVEIFSLATLKHSGVTLYFTDMSSGFTVENILLQ